MHPLSGMNALKDSCTKYQNCEVFYTPDVCYNNMKYAMISQLQNPPAEFADVIKSHFYWKKQRILEVIILNVWFKFSSVLKCNAIQSGKYVHV